MIAGKDLRFYVTGLQRGGSEIFGIWICIFWRELSMWFVYVCQIPRENRKYYNLRFQHRIRSIWSWIFIFLWLDLFFGSVSNSVWCSLQLLLCLVCVVDIFRSPSRSQHVTHDRGVLWKIDNYSMKIDPYLHMRVSYTHKMKESVTPLEWSRWLWIDADFSAWDPYQSWRLRRSCTFQSCGYNHPWYSHPLYITY